MALRLYANSLSPFVRKVRITLYEKAVEFVTVEIERGAQRAELLRINPRGEVPALVDGETVVTGSATERDGAQAVAAWERTATNPDPFFRSDRIHWRGERVEWALRLGFGDRLAREVAAGRAYFS